jgi:hypothetical protein
MLDYPVILAGSSVILVLLSIVVWITVGIIPALLVFAVAGLVLYLLHVFGKFDVKADSSGLRMDFHETAAAPHEEKKQELHIKEVFHVSQQVSYEEAPAVCAAYESELASFDQLQEAFALGAEWCSYGWSAGGMALYPTQSSTWSALQQEPQEAKRVACGHPGVNGGYFDPKMKFGVNCYGNKPANRQHIKFPQPLPSQDPGFNGLVNKFKAMLPTMELNGFNRTIWSEKGIPGQIGKGVSDTANTIEGGATALWKSL